MKSWILEWQHLAQDCGFELRFLDASTLRACEGRARGHHLYGASPAHVANDSEQCHVTFLASDFNFPILR